MGHVFSRGVGDAALKHGRKLVRPSATVGNHSADKCIKTHRGGFHI